MKLLEKIWGTPNKIFRKSYSQCGEDMMIDFILEALFIKNPTYLDVGCNDPLYLNNTYFFYKYKNGKGILVEPNPHLVNKIKSKRQNDFLLNAGIGLGEVTEANYYMMDWHEFNTFSETVAKETQEHYKGQNNLKQVIKVKLITINEILETHFKTPPDILSIDVEGLDLEILKTLNFEKFRPKIICTETKVAGNINQNPIVSFLSEKGYAMFCKTPINGIFVDEKQIDTSKI
ncbi:MAG: FkbM family methyltransferase [Bacteroidetes bacterium]|nr:FkbM family methyltransferase [Bacteroidota bacterium]